MAGSPTSSVNRAAKAERDIGTWSASEATVHWRPGSRWMSEIARPICGSCSAPSQPDGAADHVDALAAPSVSQDLVALAELFARELVDARRRRLWLAAQPVPLAVGDERQLVRGETPRLRFRRLEPAASGGDHVEPQVALERRQLETERGGELRAAVEGAAQLEEMQRLTERIGGRGPRFGTRGQAISMTGGGS